MDAFDFLTDMPKFPFAQCKDVENPDIFFPITLRHEAESLRVVAPLCGNCLHRKECLDYAIAHEIPEGIWGGVPASERGVESVRRDWTDANQAKKIRKLVMRGLAPETVARQVGVSVSYVNTVVKRARNKGEIQSNPNTEKSQSS